jgi:drug/metabolite transporter (DMT)-like permease
MPLFDEEGAMDVTSRISIDHTGARDMIITGYLVTTPLTMGKKQRLWHAVHALFRKPSSRSLRVLGYGAFVLTSLLYASFYPVAKPALDHMDTYIFVAMQMIWLVPPALFLLCWSHRQISLPAFLRSFVLGSCMAAALFCLTLAIAATSITETAMFSCMNGVIVVMVSWLIFRERIHLFTWIACACSGGGIVVLLSVSHLHWQGDLLAFIGGLLLTGYTFLIERLYFHPHSPHTPKQSLRAACGLEWLTMAGETLLVALLFGDWHTVQMHLPSDLLIVSYAGLATTLLPMLMMVVMRRYINGVTVTFIAVLEPIMDACFAFFFVHEHLLPQIYLGGMLAIASMVLQACAGSSRLKLFLARGKHVRWSLFRQRIVLPQEDFGARLRVMPDVPLGNRACLLLAHLWERPDGVDLLTLHRLTGIPCGYARRLLVSLQRRGYVAACHTMHETSRYQLNPSWDRKSRQEMSVLNFLEG